MTMLTVDDLARDLKVRNEDLLKELVMMGFAVEGPESPLETDDPAGLRAQLVTILPQREVVEKRIKPTVIRRRMKKSPDGVERYEDSPEPFPRPSGEPRPAPLEARGREDVQDVRTKDAAKPVAKKIRKPEPARIIEMPPKADLFPAGPEEAEPDGFATERAVSEETVGATGQPDALIETEPASAAVTPPQLRVEPRASLEVSGVAESVKPEREALSEDELAAGVPQTLPHEGPQARTEEPTTPEERRAALDKNLRKKKKKEKRVQPAQIIGRVELKKEPPREPERPERTERPERVERPERPAGERPAGERPVGPRPPRPEFGRGPSPAGPPGPRPGGAPHPPAVIFSPDAAAEEERRKKKKKDRKPGEGPEPRVEDDGLKVRRRKEVVLRDALYDDVRRGGRLRGKGKKPKLRKTEITLPKASKRRIKVPDLVTVANLAHKMSVKGTEVIQHLLTLGVAATLNEGIDFDTATLVATEFGFEAEPIEQSEKDMLPALVMDTIDNVAPRPPVVTVMGHVDHGKTSLLDAIRSTHVTDSEAGGITQHIGAYKVRVDKGEVVFLDTPGHEAFTAMRARGAQVTDFVVLVVAADDGVMDQTREAINHSRAANVPIIVAVNKMDKPDADKDRVIRELSEFGLIPESWGGETLFCYVSAKSRMGIEELLDVILLQAEMMELKANPNKQGIGTVVEARLDKGKGPVGTVLVKEGTLRLGDPFVAGTNYGKIRAMLDHEGRSVESAGPSTPVEVQGFSGVPDAGDSFLVVDEEKVARQVSVHRQHKQREHDLAASGPASLEDLLARMQEQEAKELLLVVKADVQGSVEAVKEALLGIPSQEIKVKVIHSGVGAITESDVMLASASGAIIVGFNVRPAPKATQLAEVEKVDLRLYTIIYEALEDVRKAMEGMLAPIEKETVTGRAEVIQIFSVPKIGVIGGCHVRSGKIERSNQVRLIRDDRVVYQGKISSMKRFKDDIKEAVEGYECGIGLENYRDVKVGDIIEAFVIEKESAKLTA